ncbi:hypothetical protein [Flavobacterium sp. N3904]|uniref:hypothetical protein n=1 Tax=Flavobacterium sp. N3904 TaxID=2986835 RepID=UPI002224C70A|nr:hypothetical protein [Flavobacterium sp. N3904]
MFENIDELIDVNLRLLYTSKSQFMMRINFKDELGFNLKNSKIFAEILHNKGLVKLELTQGFRCDLTDYGRQVYENGGWKASLNSAQFIENNVAIVDFDSEVRKIEISLMKKFMFTSLIVLVLCFFITLLTVEFLKTT